MHTIVQVSKNLGGDRCSAGLARVPVARLLDAPDPSSQLPLLRYAKACAAVERAHAA